VVRNLSIFIFECILFLIYVSSFVLQSLSVLNFKKIYVVGLLCSLLCLENACVYLFWENFMAPTKF
jgi:hypothetical protein